MLETRTDTRWRTPRWVAPVLGVLSFLFVLVAGGAVVGDWTLRNSEMRNLVSAIEMSENEMRITQEQVTAAFAPFDVGGALTPEETALLTRKLADIAADAQRRIERAGLDVSAVQVMPWHTAVLRAQESYVIHNGAWVDYMARAAQDPVEFVNPQPFVNESFFAAEPIITGAVPIPALYNLDQRVRQIFIEGTPDEIESDQATDITSS
jgi:hypothetical protein